MKVNDLDGGWTREYLDTETGQHWIKYVVDERGFFVNLMLVSPKPTTDEIVELCFTSRYPDEVSAAATRLVLEEQLYKKEYRQKLIGILNQLDISRLSQTEKARLKSIIQAAQLTDVVNK